jgi:hypothetical protein
MAWVGRTLLLLLLSISFSSSGSLSLLLLSTGVAERRAPVDFDWEESPSWSAL